MSNFSNMMLTSPDEIKASTYVNNNVDDDILGGSIREAQENHLADIIGRRLLDKVKELVYNAMTDEHPSIEDAEYAAYKTLLDDFICPYLNMKSQVIVTVPLTAKLRNMGVTQDNDTNVFNGGITSAKEMSAWCETQAAHRATEMSKFLNENRSAFPELENHSCGCDDSNMVGRKFINTGLGLKIYRRR